MTDTHPSKDAARQSDLLLWIGGAAVAAVGVAWLVFLSPWAGSSSAPDTPPPVQLATPDTPPPVQLATAAIAPAESPTDSAAADGSGPTSAQSENGETALGDPLHMAQLAYEAGMLVEPEEYSAWTLYSKVVKSEPTNTAAREGLAKVADDLVRRGETALEQGRFDDARATVERIRAMLPDHAGAKALADKIWPAATVTAATIETFKPAPPAQQPPPIAPVPVAVEPTPTPAPPPRPKVDPVVEANEAFNHAMAESRLLTPADRSAKHYVEVMVAANPDHEITRDARLRLSRELLSRAAQSLEALDADAARVWIDQAEGVGIDPAGVHAARAALVQHQIAMESQKRIPASALKMVSYVAPEYPSRAEQLNVKGWVDVEFTVKKDGTTADVTVVDASHDSYFRKEAVTAVSKWRFEPRIFLGQPIEQRAYTHIRFVL